MFDRMPGDTALATRGFGREGFGVEGSDGSGGAGPRANLFGDVGGYMACGCCGRYHAVSDGGTSELFAGLNADDRGGRGPNNKASLDPTAAGFQITRGLPGWSGLGQPANVTFAFRANQPTTLPTDVTGWSRFTDVQIQATLIALQSWSDVANITFTRVSSSVLGEEGYSDNATILFNNYSGGQSAAAAFAYLPGSAANTSAAGDVWVNNGLGYNATPVALAYGQHVLVHEIGHAIGLRHPADYNASEGVSITYAANATYYEDSRQYTVMSYFSEGNTGGSFGGRFASAPLMDDIASAQRLYGANMTTRTGDTVYGFNSNAERGWFSTTGGAVVFCVWDAAGYDTFDFSGYTQAAIIDLRQGAFSDVGGLRGNVSIAIGAVIEQAIGGSGNDRLIGNAGDNRLTGGAGNDVIDGGLGIDTAIFSQARSAYTIVWNGQTATISGPDGTDTVTNVEFLAFADQTVAATPTGGLVVGGDITANTINGTAFNDVLNGGGGADVLTGLGGNDVLDGGSGADSVSAGDGDDILIGGLGDDRIDGGAGFDIADYGGAPGGVQVDLSTGRSAGGHGVDTLTGIEEVRGSTFADVLTGDAGANVLRGGGGLDTLNGGAGDDQLFAGAPGILELSKARDTVNATRETAVNVDGVFTLAARGDVTNATSVPHATVVATGHGGVEFYAVTVGAGSTVLVDIDGASFDSTVAVYDAAGNLIGENDDGAAPDGGSATDSAFSFTAAAAGVFYIQVARWVANTTGGAFTSGPPAAGSTYTLHISSSGHAVAAGQPGAALNGGEGNDLLHSGSGDDAMDGGSGTDTAVFTGVRANYTVATTNGVTTVTGPDGADRLVNVERLQFADQTITVGAPSTGVTLTGTAANDVLTGTEFTDSLTGGAGNDTLNGLAGADVLNGGTGDDTLNGGAGVDTALYTGVRRQYQASSVGISGNGEGSDTLNSVETLRFIDGALTFDVDSQAAQVMRLYDAALDRQPDQGGFESLLDQLEGGRVDLRTLAQAFIQSPEFQARYGNLSNQQFVEQLYRFCLDREGDPQGIASWTQNLNNGLSRQDALVFFSESAEHRGLTAPILNRGLWVADDQALVIARMYDATFDRLADSGGLAAWTQNLKNGVSLLDIANAFAASGEFQSRYGSLNNQQFVEQMYRFCLNREGDPQGVAGWVGQLNAGMSRGQVLAFFSESAEHVALTRDLFLGGIRTTDSQFAPAEETDTGKGDGGAQVSPLADDDRPLVLVQAEDAKAGQDGGAQVLPMVDAEAPLVLPAAGAGKGETETLITPPATDGAGDEGPLVLPMAEAGKAEGAETPWVMDGGLDWDIDGSGADAFVLPALPEDQPLVLPGVVDGLDDQPLVLPQADEPAPDAGFTPPARGDLWLDPHADSGLDPLGAQWGQPAWDRWMH